MKKILLSSLVAAATAIPAFAGVNNLNYQAVIKNGSAVVADKQVNLKFELLDSSEKVVFAEEQSPVTNGAGYVACQLGKENDLSELNWGNLTLRVSVDLGSGYQVFSTEAVSSVPTALYALKSADSDMIIDAVEGLMQDVENNKATILGINAEVAKFDGYIEDSEARFDNLGENLDNAFGQMAAQFEEVNGQLENLNNLGAVVRANESAIEELNTNIEAFAEMNEARLDKMQKQMDEADQGFANLGENLDNSFAQMTAKFEEVDGQLENLNQVSAVVRANESAIEELNTNIEAFAEMNEARLDKMQKQMDEADQSFANLGENLDNLVNQMEAKNAEIDGQLENLNNVSAVIRVNEENIEMLTDEVANILKENEDTKSTLTNMGAEIARIDGLAGEVETLGEVVKDMMDPEGGLASQLGEISTEVAALVQDNEVSKEQLRGISADITRLDGVAADFNDFKEEFGETFQALSEFQQGVTVTIEELKAEIAALKAEIAALKGE